MRFSAATIALFAGLAVAGDIETVYSTEDVTITSCAPTVTDCPSRPTPVTSDSEVPAEPTGTSPVETSVPVVPEVPSSSSVAVPPAQPTASSPVVPQQPEQPSGSMSVIPVTTCIPTVTYSTISVTPTVAPTTSKPVIPGNPTGVAPTGSASGTASAS